MGTVDDAYGVPDWLVLPVSATRVVGMNGQVSCNTRPEEGDMGGAYSLSPRVIPALGCMGT